MKEGNRIDPADFGQGERQLSFVWGGGQTWKPWWPTMEELRKAGGQWSHLADRVERVRVAVGTQQPQRWSSVLNICVHRCVPITATPSCCVHETVRCVAHADH